MLKMELEACGKIRRQRRIWCRRYCNNAGIERLLGYQQCMSGFSYIALDAPAHPDITVAN